MSVLLRLVWLLSYSLVGIIDYSDMGWVTLPTLRLSRLINYPESDCPVSRRRHRHCPWSRTLAHSNANFHLLASCHPSPSHHGRASLRLSQHKRHKQMFPTLFPRNPNLLTDRRNIIIRAVQAGTRTDITLVVKIIMHHYLAAQPTI